MRRTRNPDLPFVFVNFAMTADGKITTGNRKVAGFSSARDQEHMFELRTKADAVMAGARTVDLNPVTMGTGGRKYRMRRLHHGFSEYNLRVIVSGSGTVNLNAKIFTKKTSPIIVLTTQRAGTKRLEALRKRAQDVHVSAKGVIDFEQALCWLKRKWKVKRLLCEGGGELNDALFQAGLVNELHLTISPRIFGGQHAPTVADGRGCSELRDATRLDLKSSKRVGGELFLIYRVRNKLR